MYMIGNETITKTKTIFGLVKVLPFFDFHDITPVEKDRTYLAILLYRYIKSGKIIRLKKGFYTTKEYIDETQKKQFFSLYLEFLANVLYQPSYLSLEYILSQHNLMTEVTTNFTSVTINKTKNFSNSLGKFFYHTIRKNLFSGFHIVKENDLTVFKATKAKALFDFLYLRKNLLIDEKAMEELRLNLTNLTAKDIREFKAYVNLEGSKKMKNILNLLIKTWKQ